MKTKIIYSLFTSLNVFLCLALHSQNSAVEWVRQIGGTGNQTGLIVTDNYGNNYVHGSFTGLIDFDPGQGIFNLSSNGTNYDCFIQKLDSNGNFLWAVSIGGTNADYIKDTKLDVSGNLIVIGSFSNTVDFDPGPGVYNLSSVGSVASFILKLDTNGNFIWAKSFYGNQDIYPSSLAISGNGDIHIVGSFRGTADFNPGVGSFHLSSAGDSDVFIQKLDSSGNFIWAKSVGGFDIENPQAVKVDQTGNVYITGIFEGFVDFDPGSGSYNLNSILDYDVFILKLTDNGSFVWAKQLGGPGLDIVNSMAIDDNGNIYTAGQFEQTVDFDPGSATFYRTAAGSFDGYIQKLDGNGNFQWMSQLEGSGFGNYTSLVVGVSGDIYSIGTFENTADFNPGSGNYNLTAKGYFDTFIQKLDSSGNFIWANNIGSSQSNTHSLGINLSLTEDIVLTGFFDATVDFDPGTAVLNLTPISSNDIFILKLNESALLTNIRSISPVNQIQIYPNPSSGDFTIQSEEKHFNHYSLFDLSGKLIQSEMINDSRGFSIEIQSQKGIYLLELNDLEGNVYRQKLIKN